MLSAYTIGKEKIFVEVARRTGLPVCVTAAKMAVMQLLEWTFDLPFDRVFTCEPSRTCIHIVTWNWIGETWPFFRPNYPNIETFAAAYAPDPLRPSPS